MRRREPSPRSRRASARPAPWRLWRPRVLPDPTVLLRLPVPQHLLVLPVLRRLRVRPDLLVRSGPPRLRHPPGPLDLLLRLVQPGLTVLQVPRVRLAPPVPLRPRLQALRSHLLDQSVLVSQLLPPGPRVPVSLPFPVRPLLRRRQSILAVLQVRSRRPRPLDPRHRPRRQDLPAPRFRASCRIRWSAIRESPAAGTCPAGARASWR